MLTPARLPPPRSPPAPRPRSLCRLVRLLPRGAIIGPAAAPSWWLRASALPVCGSAPRRCPAAAPPREPRPATARSTILFFLCGGASHIDTWDMKPDAPAEYRGPFQPIRHFGTRHPTVRTLAAARPAGPSSGRGPLDFQHRVNTNDHHAGYYYNLTGHAADPTFLSLGNNRTPMPDDWPYMGSVVRRSCRRGAICPTP